MAVDCELLSAILFLDSWILGICYSDAYFGWRFLGMDGRKERYLFAIDQCRGGCFYAYMMKRKSVCEHFRSAIAGTGAGSQMAMWIQ